MPLFCINYKFVSMKKISLFLLILVAASCSSDDGGSITPPDGGGSGGSGSQTDLPSNLVVILDIQGQNSENPYGDGSGVFNLTATADNAVSFGFKVDTADEVQNSSGNFTYTVNSQGINQFREFRVTPSHLCRHTRHPHRRGPARGGPIPPKTRRFVRGPHVARRPSPTLPNSVHATQKRSHRRSLLSSIYASRSGV